MNETGGAAGSDELSLAKTYSGSSVRLRQKWSFIQSQPIDS